MRVRTTSTQRTYRYVRLALIGATVLVGVAVGIELAAGASLPSISAAYYGPAGPVFVGGLSAIALALLALSGRSLEQALLDVAAVLALAVAYIPTTVAASVCEPVLRCVPPDVRATVVNNGAAAASVILLGAVTAVIVALVQGTASRGVAVTIGVIVMLTVAGVGWAVVSPESFLGRAHEVAAVTFFVLIAAVAAIAAWRPHATGRRSVRLRRVYAAVAIGILLTLVLIVVGLLTGVARAGFPLVLVGESVALAFFGVFWVVQTAELWNEPDPRLRE
ncbi:MULTISPECIES: hypothetical protein [Microbacterium]|uniref:hypothetical protein n=1 Tax=Microbacterium TaxID=33882 RepID=UPI002783A741|nr:MULTISPECIES: hypothetical protein [Microbacterium]MDQ1084501.1 preprotein translocase subunit SecG [Microbacterium sp. SORGH_AS_0344]MDQ1170222.1 preprotein translocase subunit SecG [Microbacterium proteolyticum]